MKQKHEKFNISFIQPSVEKYFKTATISIWPVCLEVTWLNEGEKQSALEGGTANIYLLSFQQHNIFIITEHAGGLTASKDTPQKMIAHVFVDECHSRPRDDFHFVLLSINEHCQKHFCAFSHPAHCSMKYCLYLKLENTKL